MARVVVFDEFGDADVLRIVDEPIEEPGPAELRIKIEAFGVNRLDQMMRAGQYPAPIRLPRARLGVEGAAVGAEAHRYLERGQQMGKVVVTHSAASGTAA